MENIEAGKDNRILTNISTEARRTEANLSVFIGCLLLHSVGMRSRLYDLERPDSSKAT